MIVLDANILLYAYDSTSPRYDSARRWVEATFLSGELVGLPWQSVAAFIRVATNTRLRGTRYTVEEAAGIVDQWLEQPGVRLLCPGEHHWHYLRQMMIDGQAGGPLFTDAQLAAITIEHGGVLHTNDRDFNRFPGLRWANPLA